MLKALLLFALQLALLATEAVADNNASTDSDDGPGTCEVQDPLRMAADSA